MEKKAFAMALLSWMSHAQVNIEDGDPEWPKYKTTSIDYIPKG
jgi:hypothetical protein